MFAGKVRRPALTGLFFGAGYAGRCAPFSKVQFFNWFGSFSKHVYPAHCSSGEEFSAMSKTGFLAKSVRRFPAGRVKQTAS